MTALKTLGGVAAFLAAYASVDWFAGVTAPVLGPLLIVALIGALIWALVKISKWEAR